MSTMTSHSLLEPRRSSSPAIFLQTPLRMRRPAHRRSFGDRWWSPPDVARRRRRSEELLSKAEEETAEVARGRRGLATRAYLIGATLRDLREMSVDAIVFGKNKATAVVSRQSSVPVQLATTDDRGPEVDRRRRNRSPDRTTTTTRQQQQRRCNSRQRALLVAKFKLVGKLIIACHKIVDEHKFGNRSYENIFPYVRTLHFRDYDDSDAAHNNIVIFNPNKYKANKQLRIPEEARRILSKDPLDRTQTELLYAKTALLSLKSYAEYPVRMQMKIVAAGMYERYESKRMILRQGHEPTSFYFILSGSVVVMVQETDFPESIPIGYRGKGDTFGELAMIGKMRQSSVISKETIELLSLNVEDFENIFMFGGIKNLTDPDHFEFLRSLDMLKDWPIEKLVDLTGSNEAVFMYFPRGEILVRDSQFLETLVIVKSGSVRVIKKMKRHHHTAPVSKKAKTSRLRREFDEELDKSLFPRLNEEREKGRSILTEVHVPRRLDHHGADDIGSLPRLPEITNASAVHRHSLHIVLRQNGSASARDHDRNYARRRTMDGRGTLQPSGQLKNKRKTRKKKPTGNDKEREEEKEKEKEMMGRKQHIRGIAEDLDSNRSIMDSTGSDAEVDLYPTFIHIQTLRKGQVFGLSNLIHEDQPNLCAISDGAECIMLNKNFYLRHAPDKLIAMLKLTCVPYPTEAELHEKLEKSLSWRKYKDRILAKTMSEISRLRIRNSQSQRHSALSSNLGN